MHLEFHEYLFMCCKLGTGLYALGYTCRVNGASLKCLQQHGPNIICIPASLVKTILSKSQNLCPKYYRETLITKATFQQNQPLQLLCLEHILRMGTVLHVQAANRGNCNADRVIYSVKVQTIIPLHYSVCSKHPVKHTSQPPKDAPSVSGKVYNVARGLQVARQSVRIRITRRSFILCVLTVLTWKHIISVHFIPAKTDDYSCRMKYQMPSTSACGCTHVLSCTSTLP